MNYPFEDKNKELLLESTPNFLIVDNQLVHLSLHNLDGFNISKNLKLFYNTGYLNYFSCNLKKQLNKTAI